MVGGGMSGEKIAHGYDSEYGCPGYVICEVCKGVGLVEEKLCQRCGGSGREECWECQDIGSLHLYPTQ